MLSLSFKQTGFIWVSCLLSNFQIVGSKSIYHTLWKSNLILDGNKVNELSVKWSRIEAYGTQAFNTNHPMFLAL